MTQRMTEDALESKRLHKARAKEKLAHIRNALMTKIERLDNLAEELETVEELDEFAGLRGEIDSEIEKQWELDRHKAQLDEALDELYKFYEAKDHVDMESGLKPLVMDQ